MQQEIREMLENIWETGESAALEEYLMQKPMLPDGRLNLSLANAFALVIGQIATTPDPPVEEMEDLLDGWAALSLEEVPVDTEREFLIACAVSAYRQVAIRRPDWWEDEFGKLSRLTQSPRPRIQQMAELAIADIKSRFHRDAEAQPTEGAE
jgi:hypothetical protein